MLRRTVPAQPQRSAAVALPRVRWAYRRRDRSSPLRARSVRSCLSQFAVRWLRPRKRDRHSAQKRRAKKRPTRSCSSCISSGRTGLRCRCPGPLDNYSTLKRLSHLQTFCLLPGAAAIYLRYPVRGAIGARSRSFAQETMAHEEEVLGKAYDSRLMRRLLTYLRPYRWQVTIAIAAIILKSFCDVLGPYLVKVAVDRYLAPVKGAVSGLWSWLSPRPLHGIAQISAIYFGLLILTFVFEFLQTYFMQWTGQKVMFDLRSQIFRHLQRMHVAFYDKNPVGRLVTRVTTDVDALNEMFTSGVVSIFEDFFVLIGILGFMLCMNWKLALITFVVLPFIVVATKLFRDKVLDSYRRIRTAIARINSYLQEHVSGMVVLQLFNRERKAYQRFSEINRSHMDAFKDAIMAYSVYYPVVDFFSAVAIACVIWFGGQDEMRRIVVSSVSIEFSRHSLLSFHVVATTVSLGVLIAFTQYAQRFFRPIMDFSEKYNILQSAMAASERIFKLLDTPVDIVSPAVTKKPPGPGRIEFDHVWFAYRDMPATGDAPLGTDRVGTGLRPVQAEHSSAGPLPENGNAVTPDWG